MKEEVWSNDGRKWQGKTEVLGEKHVAGPVCPQRMSQELAWNVSRASAVINGGKPHHVKHGF